MIDETIRIAVAGNVDSGKSTLAGVIVNNLLDDGKGLCRNLVMRNKHELESGRTSNISFNNVGRTREIFKNYNVRNNWFVYRLWFNSSIC